MRSKFTRSALSHSLMRSLAGSLLNRFREQLSVEQQRTLELHFFEGYSLRSRKRPARRSGIYDTITIAVWSGFAHWCSRKRTSE